MYFIGDMISIFFHYYVKTVKFINEVYPQNVLNNEVKTIGDAWSYGYACNILRYLRFPLLSYYAVIYMLTNFGIAVRSKYDIIIKKIILTGL